VQQLPLRVLPQLPAGIYFIKLHFGRNIFRIIFILKFWTIFCPKIIFLIKLILLLLTTML
jgi:hypothetical protein